MNTWKRIFLLLVLFCYAAASSIAAAHAFPKSFDQSADSYGIEEPVNAKDMMTDCHQQTASQPSSDSINACDIFCSAISNVMTTEDTLDIEVSRLTAQIAFFRQSFASPYLSEDPHPPK